MASLCSLQHSLSQAPRARSSNPLTSLAKKGGRGRRSVVCWTSSANGQSQSPSSLYRKEETEAGRRELLLQMSLSAASLQAISASSHASADEGPAEDFKFYVDNENKFKISIPLDWQVGSGEPSNSFKSVTAFYPKENLSSNVSIVITGIGPDFTTMGSFGKVDAFAENLVNGLDRSWQRPPGVVAKLINCKDANGFYYIEYLLQNPGEKRRHIYSAIGMAFNGWYNRLYTVTGQFLEEESDKVSSKIEKAVASFRFT
ncbi:hypothetical protein SAY87_002903 [Trapa incisa]|uniref:PsbP C-terminal domain-containing protein n=1 Tax=Trapa incisa TaxID=236973 RepID=A0AAN7QH31_9MYRT|nr:hypothetical protein SAY87_002903 [Trapa incisa]